MGALGGKVAPFGIRTTIVNPGWLRTGLASPKSLVWPALAVADYAERSAAQREWWSAQDGHQSGDPDKPRPLCSRSSPRIRHRDASSPALTSSRSRSGRSTNCKRRSHPTGTCRPR